MTNIVLVHVGKILPEYIYDSIYQMLLFNKYNCSIYVLLNENVINEFKKRISLFDLNFNFIIMIRIIPLEILDNCEKLIKYKNLIKNLPDQVKNFRDEFWISTTSRFFYLEECMRIFKIDSFFHIENDIMLYENLSKIEKSLSNSIYLLKDDPNRVIPSIIYINNLSNFNTLNNYLLEKFEENLNNGRFINDMELLGSFKYCELFNADPYNEEKYIFDGAAIGQYLGGIDPRNINININMNNENEKELILLNNPTKGFLNESNSLFKANNFEFFRKKMYNGNDYLDIYYLKHKFNIKHIINLHIHSKQLYQFSSKSDLLFNDIISGDKIISLCDFVITTADIFEYHKNLANFINLSNVLIINDFKNIKIELLNNILLNFKETNNRPIKLFIYTHILDLFIEYILLRLDNSIQIELYLHNSDHSFNDIHYNLISNKNNLVAIHAQNINLTTKINKVKFLPIGIANSMFKHGDLISLYKQRNKIYMNKKTKNIYININPNTYGYRKDLLNQFIKYNIKTSKNKNYKDYLEELSMYHFCFCIRGNAFDTHRFWESLYMGVIPVIINNTFTNMNNFVNYLKELNIPFFEIKENDIEKIMEKYFINDFFTENLYKKILKNYNIYSLPELKLNYYN